MLAWENDAMELFLSSADVPETQETAPSLNVSENTNECMLMISRLVQSPSIEVLVAGQRGAKEKSLKSLKLIKEVFKESRFDRGGLNFISSDR